MAKKNEVGNVNYPIVGLKKVVKDLNNCPDGFHYDVWAMCNKDACFVWTSDLLGQNDWSEDNKYNHIKLNSNMNEYAQAIKENCGRIASHTEILRGACNQLREEYGFKVE